MLVISTDEKCGIQALERAAADLPPTPDHVRKREFNYVRHGTQTLIGALEVATGQVYAQVGDTRDEEDFADFIEYVVDANPEREIVIVADQLNTHKSAALVQLLAQFNGDVQDLGRKGKQGILKNMASRMAYLEQVDRRVRFVFTPKHCSWLNLIEVWFSGLAKRVVQLGNFVSTADLQAKLLAYLDYYNEELAHAFAWSVKDRQSVSQMVDKIKRYVSKLAT